MIDNSACGAPRTPRAYRTCIRRLNTLSTTIYHNPRCSKSRKTLELLREHGIEPDIVEYLGSPPDAQTLRAVLQALGMQASALIRTGEADFAESGLNLDSATEAQILAAISRYPKLLQRPIVVTAKGAVIGRPPENVLDIIG